MRPDRPGTDPLDAADWEALARYMAGEAPPAEAARVEGWLAEDPRRRDAVGELDRTLAALAHAPPQQLDVEGALGRVLRRAEAPVIPILERPVLPPSTVRAVRWRRAGLAAAAGLGIVLGAGLLYQRLTSTADHLPVVMQPRILESGVGQRLSARLDDGTRVVLGPASRLEVARDFGDAARAVELRGEALFEVVHDDERPFVVYAGAAAVRDLGTVFTVRVDAAGDVRVAVTEGSVLLQPAAAPAAAGVTLRRGDRGLLDPGSMPVAERGALVEDDLAWTRGRLVFDDAPMTRVAADLRRWYGVQLRFADPALAGRHLTASFEGEPVATVIEAVGLALGAPVEVRGDTVVLGAATR